MANLFSSQTPAAPDNADGSDNYSMGTYMSFSVPGTITHVRWFYPLTAQPGGVAPKANIFLNSTSTKVGGADVNMPSPGVAGGWNQVALDTPVSVIGDPLIFYCPTIWTPLRYVASSGGSSPWPLTNGPISAPSGAGRFTSGASGNVDFPTNAFNNGCYFVDVAFTPDGEETSPFSVWNGSTELPVSAVNVWNGSSEDSVTFDTVT